MRKNEHEKGVHLIIFLKYGCSKGEASKHCLGWFTIIICEQAEPQALQIQVQYIRVSISCTDKPS